MNRQLSQVKTSIALDPVADAFAGTVYGAALNIANYSGLTFAVIKGVGATGTSTLTIERCTASDGTGATAIPFKYERVTGDTRGTLTDAAAAGFNTTAGSSETYLLHVNTNRAGLAANGGSWVRVKAVEVVDSPVAGTILGLLYDGRYGGANGPTAK